MTAVTFQQTVYVIGGDKAVSHSMQFLLETHQFVVKAISNTDTFFKDNTLTEQDVVLLDVNDAEPAVFKLLNELLITVKRPKVILTSAVKSVLRETDTFKGNHIKVLFHPVAPRMLLDTIKLITGT